MATKQSQSLYAPDGSLYVTPTDGAGNLVTISPMLLSVTKTVDFNAANTDTSFPIALPTGFTKYKMPGIAVGAVTIYAATASISTANFGLFTAAAGGGFAMVSAATAITVTATADNTVNNCMTIASTNAQTETFTSTPLFFRVGTAQGSAATAKVTIFYIPVP